MNNKIVLGVAAIALALGLGAQAVKPLPEVPAEQKAELVAYLKAHEMAPEDYVIEKFKTYDFVFLGEYHRIKHDVELVHSLIPRLYKAGIYNLGIEFGCYEDQDQVDALITGKTYSEDVARRLMFRFYPAAGVIDRVMREFKGKRFGFDVVGTPFGKIKDPKTYYAWGDDDFRLEKFCDGYICQRPFPEYEGCTVDPKFITAENLQEAIDTLPNAAARKNLKTVDAFMEGMRADADMKRRFRDLE